MKPISRPPSPVLSSSEARRRILFIEDEANLRSSLAFILEREGFQVTVAATGEEAIALARTARPHLILLDLGLPGMDGFDVGKALQALYPIPRLPIVMLTGRGLPTDIVRGLKESADDYIVKPCDPEVLLARLRAVLRRSEASAGDSSRTSERIVLGSLVLELAAREAYLDKSPLRLTRTEFDLLALLAGSPHRVFSRARIIDLVRGDNYSVTERTVDFQICELRRKLNGRGPAIETVRGLGYKLRP
jgi:two-component system alkaline phosphatase synthesis response regulator PhoP